jgi:GNAT superfamily N-acetyltransferase
LPNDDIQLELREIGVGDRVTGLSLGDEAFTPLKIFVQRHAKSYAEQMLAKSYGVFEGERLVGYVTLVCGQIEVDGGSPAPDLGEAQFAHRHYPAVKIARLAVDRRYRGTGLGRKLVDFSLGIARDTIASAVGCRFVVLDAKPPSVAFYEKSGFRLINTGTNRARAEPVMFLDLKGTPSVTQDFE